MNKILFSFLLFFCILFTIGSQEDPKAKKSSSESKYPLKKYVPFYTPDHRIKMNNLNFSRHFASDGTGEFLDVVFSLENLTTEDIPLYVYVATFFETNFVDKKYRTWISHTTWRKRDIYLEDFIIQKVSIIPNDILPSLIWGDKDPDYMFFTDRINVRKNYVSTEEPSPLFFPPIWKYIQYMSYNTNKGLRVVLHGIKAPPSNKLIQTGSSPSLLHESTQEATQSKPMLKYTIIHNAKRLDFRSYHFSSFRNESSIFNRVCIVLFDAKKADKNLQENSSAKPILKKIYSINTAPQRR